jgi:hypothetical protein
MQVVNVAVCKYREIIDRSRCLFGLWEDGLLVAKLLGVANILQHVLVLWDQISMNLHHGKDV